MAYYKKKSQYICPAFSIIALKSVMRIYDLEDSVGGYNATEFCHMGIVTNITICFFTMIFSISFGHIKGQIYYIGFYTLLWALGNSIFLMKFDEHYCVSCEKTELVNHLPNFIITVIMLFFFLGVIMLIVKK